MIGVYITCKDETEAKNVSKALLDKKLIACANIFPIKSMFRWEGEFKEESEHAIIAKSMEEKFDALKEEVKKVHSYDVPCITAFKSDANQEFMDWVKEETK
ncbi:MAG: divalent-cation tolerance protein CutA [bacterium]|nr:divalent-cation tolerance protein CutA [bacterium]